MSINFTLNNGNTITLGKKSNYIKVIIHDDTKAETPTTMVTDYTAKLFAEAGLTHKPTFDEYKAIPEAICPSDILVKTEISDLRKDLFDRILRRIRPSDGTGLTAYGKKC